MKFYLGLCILMVGLVVSAVSCSSQHKKGKKMVSIGSIAPDFTLPDEQGIEHTLSTMKGKKIVIYFYPKDDTPGCTKEACSLRDGYETLQQAGIAIFGISADSPASHRAFKEKYRLPFTLLSDKNKAVAGLYDAKGSIFIKRVTFLIDESGTIISKLDNVDVANHADQIVQAFGGR